MLTVESTGALQNENRLRLLIDSIEDYAIYMLDSAGLIVTWNRGAELNTGYSSLEVMGRHFQMFFVTEGILSNAPANELAEAVETGRCCGEGWRLRKSGERYWASYVHSAIRDDSGNLTGFATVSRDLSDVKRQQDAMRMVEMAMLEERDRLYNAAESSLDAMYICQALRGSTGEIEDFVFTYLNSKVEKMVTYPRSVLLGSRMCEVFPVNRTSGLFEQYRRVVLTGDPLVQEVPFEEGTIRASWVRMQVVKVGDGIAISASDISQRKHDEQRILHQAQHDDLTGLPNRSLLNDRIAQAIERSRRFGGKVAVFLVDLDSFKRINDTFGHAAGDTVLVTAAVRLKAAVRATDTVIRMGGDEFVVVMPDISELADIQVCAGKILDSLQSSMDLGVNSVRTTCSVGMAIYPDSASTIEELLSQADAAMYEAKRAGKNQSAIAGSPKNSSDEILVSSL